LLRCAPEEDQAHPHKGEVAAVRSAQPRESDDPEGTW